MTHLAPRRCPRGLAAVLLGLLVALALAVPGAAQAASGRGAATDGVPPGKAWVRVGHFVPGMGATAIELRSLDGSGAPIKIADQTTYGDVSPYVKVVPGSYTVTVRMSSTTQGSAPMLSRSVRVFAGQARTLAILGSSSAPRLALLSDDLTPPAAGTARVRLLSASGEADSVTVTAVGGPTIARDAVQGQATSYATVPAGSWTLKLQSDLADSTLQAVRIASGSVYTVVVLDAGGRTVKLDVVTDAAGAVMTPRGGAKTGLGGMAPSRIGSSEASGPMSVMTGWETTAAFLALLGLSMLAWVRLRVGRLSR